MYTRLCKHRMHLYLTCSRYRTDKSTYTLKDPHLCRHSSCQTDLLSLLNRSTPLPNQFVLLQNRPATPNSHWSSTLGHLRPTCYGIKKLQIPLPHQPAEFTGQPRFRMNLLHQPTRNLPNQPVFPSASKNLFHPQQAQKSLLLSSEVALLLQSTVFFDTEPSTCFRAEAEADTRSILTLLFYFSIWTYLYDHPLLTTISRTCRLNLQVLAIGILQLESPSSCCSCPVAVGVMLLEFVRDLPQVLPSRCPRPHKWKE